MPEPGCPRVLAIGDIHGYAAALDRLLAAVNPRPDDLVVTLGDYIDRGPDSSGVVARLLKLRRACRLVPLLGNHEQMILEARGDRRNEADWLLAGGRQTLASYSVLNDAGQLVDVPDEHWEFFEQTCVDWFETDTHFFVHANAYPDVPLADQPVYMLRWEFFDDPPPHVSGKVMVCGHTPQKRGWPRYLGHAVCIDTWIYGKGWLTCLDVTTGRVWQARQSGEHRTGWVDEPAADA